MRCKRLLEVTLHVGALGTRSLNTLGASRKVSGTCMAQKSPGERCWGQPSSLVGAAEVLPLLSPPGFPARCARGGSTACCSSLAAFFCDIAARQDTGLCEAGASIPGAAQAECTPGANRVWLREGGGKVSEHVKEISF